VLVASAWLLRPLERRVVVPIALRTDQLMRVVGRGGIMARLGGMRSAFASACWLRANLAWERRDALATAALIELTVAVDERPVYFWLNGARMLAYDVPEWRRNDLAPAAWRSRVNEEQAQQALRLLEKGLRWHGPDPALYIEMANIHLRRRNDREAAARYYRLAAEQTGAPHYAARIHGELLRELGRPQEALAWLREVLPRLEAGDPLARREVVLERIEMLEREVAAR
jgi:tetratricopeptide (TPR) repeat protein